MPNDVIPDLFKTLARRSQCMIEFRLGLDLRFAQRHLHAAVRVDLSLARSFNRQKNHLPKTVDHGRLHAIGLRRRHTAERLQRQHHVAQSVRV